MRPLGRKGELCDVRAFAEKLILCLDDTGATRLLLRDQEEALSFLEWIVYVHEREPAFASELGEDADRTQFFELAAATLECLNGK